MSSSSNDQGRGFEYITLLILEREIRNYRSVVIETNGSLLASKAAWERIAVDVQYRLTQAAEAAVDSIFELEPLITEDGTDMLTLCIQQDKKGERGDVRDILIVRRGIKWEIGLSLKHNHFAVKHSRLSGTIDFGASWFGIPCSANYWAEVAPIFSTLEAAKKRGAKWSELPDKAGTVYVPLLRAFIAEVERSAEQDGRVPRRMVEYLLGKYDFYKMIGVDATRSTQLLTFNLHGTLNKNGKRRAAQRKIPVATLPTRIVNMSFKPKSQNTVELYMDGGWQFSFRIHNAATKVEPSLKFDIQIVGMPTTIIAINCLWAETTTARCIGENVVARPAG